ncbi:MAG: hypothetical protein JNK96_10020 [Betaproteobacteria bacterium]|nr:hypothetical protein [Betaproteobacteria bacterium]HNE42444.1 hypothetical protein [Rhodocyclaceae bacterium]
MSTKKTALSLAVGTAFAATALLAPVVHAADNPFSLTKLDSGYQLAEADKAKDGKCGEAKCGADKKKDGKCSADKKKDGKCSAEKKKDGKCGEAKCGADKKK